MNTDDIVYNARDYGAKGDGVTDDRISIQSAIDAAYEAGGGIVYLPTGEYRVSGGYKASKGALLLRDNVTLEGDGMGATTVKVLDGWDQKLTGIIRTPSGEVNVNITLRDLTIDGNMHNASGEIDGFFTGVTPDVNASDQNILVERVEIMHVSRYGFDPHEQTTGLTIRDSVAHHNGKDGFVADWLIDSVFENNIAYANGRHGFNVVTVTHDMLLKNNIAYDNGDAGIVVQRGSDHVAWPENIRIEGGKSYGNGKEGVLVKTSHNVTVEGVEIYDNDSYGIRLRGANDATITGNKIYNNAQSKHGGYDEIRIEAYDDTEGLTGLTYPALNNTILENFIYSDGEIKARYTVYEKDDGSDGNKLIGNVIGDSLKGGVVLHGPNSSHTLPGESPQADIPAHPPAENPDINDGPREPVQPPSEGEAPEEPTDPPAAPPVEEPEETEAEAPPVVEEEAEEEAPPPAPPTEDTAIEPALSHDVVSGNRSDEHISTGNGDDTVRANKGDDIVDGGSGADQLQGDSGNDTLLGGTGNDNLSGGNDHDWLFGEDGADTLGGGRGNDVLSGGAHNDVLVGDSGNDILDGGSGDDTLEGNRNHDVLDGGDGNDWLYGATGNDYLFGAEGDDDMYGDSGIDTLDGGNGNDYLSSGDHNDMAVGGAGDDTIHGGKGNDIMAGEAGNDLILGGRGDDRLIGGLGEDQFAFYSKSGMDVIEDYVKGEDVIQVYSGVLRNIGDVMDNLSYGDGSAVLDFGRGHQVTVLDVAPGSLDESDFQII